VLQRSVLIGAVLMVVVAACSPGTDPPTTVTEAPGSTQAPDTTEAPGSTQASDTTEAPGSTQASNTTQAGEDGSDSETPWWLLLLVLGALLILIVVFVSRGSKKTVVVPQRSSSWKDDARAGYVDARWLYDAMTEDLAVWRGNQLFNAPSGAATPPGTSLSATWQQLDGRMGQATDELYAFESAMSDPKSAEMGNATITSLQTLRSAVDARADARASYCTVESKEVSDTPALQDAREREVRASRTLAASRSDLGAALTNLSTLI
jgi:hypothetical protein